MSAAWAPCPRCASPRVRARPGPRRGPALGLATVALLTLPGGLLAPCLWGVSLALAGGAVVLWRGQGGDWVCLACAHRWDAPP